MVADEQVFVGRENELKLLNEALDKAVDNTLQICLVAGDPGDGKTTLVEHFAKMAGSAFPKLDYVIGSCDISTGKRDIYEPFREIFAQLTGVRARHIESFMTAEREFDTRNKIRITAEILREFAPELIGTLVPIGALISKAALSATDQVIKRRMLVSSSEDGKVKHAEIRNQSVAFFRRRAQKGEPLILVLDDVQWIDSLSLELLWHLAENLQDAAMMVILTFRPNELVAGKVSGELRTIKDLIDQMRQKHNVLEISLRTARSASGGEFVKEFLSSNACRVSSEFTSAFLDHTGASPIASVELLHFLRHRGVLKQNSLGVWEEFLEVSQWQSIPSGLTRIDALIEGRLSQLNDLAMEMLRIASVQGYEFTAQVIALVTGQEERTVLQVLSNELGKKHDLVREMDEEVAGEQVLSHFRFTNVLYREHVYTSLGMGEKRLLHRRVAQVLEGLYQMDTMRVAVQLASHYELGKDLMKSTDFLICVGDRLARNVERHMQYEEVLRTYQRALALAREANYASGVVDALRFAAVKARLARESEEDYSEAKRLLEECKSLAEKEDLPEALSYVLRGLGRVHRHYGNNSQAVYFYMESLNLAKRVGNLREAAACYTNIGVVAASEGRFEDASFYYQKRYEIARELDDADGKALALMNWSSSLRRLADGRPEERNVLLQDAERKLIEAEDLNRLIGDANRELGIKIAQVRVFVSAGKLTTATSALSYCLRTVRSRGFLKRKREALEALAYFMEAMGSKDVLLPETIGYVMSRSKGNKQTLKEISSLMERVRNYWDEAEFVEAEARGASTTDEDETLTLRAVQLLDSLSDVNLETDHVTES